MLEHFLIHRDPTLGGKEDDQQKKIYGLNVIPGKYLASFIKRGATLQKNTLLSKKVVYPNILFEQLLTNIMACQGFPPFLGT